MLRRPIVLPALTITLLLLAKLLAGCASNSIVPGGGTDPSAATSESSAPRVEVDAAWPKPLPNRWLMGQAAGVAVDARDHVWVVQRPKSLTEDERGATLNPPRSLCCAPAPPVLEFDADGVLLQSWGGPGTGYSWPENEHGIFVDHKDNVWIAGNGPKDGQILKFTRDGKFLMKIGEPGVIGDDADPRHLNRPANMVLDPATNELFVADGYGNHRVIVFDADTGAYKRTWGAFGNKPVDDDHCEVVTPTSFSDPGPQQFSIVHAIRVAKDGTVYVADREYRRVQMFTKDGKFVKQLVRKDIPFARDLALSPDPDQQFLYVGGGNGIFIVDRKTLGIVGNIQPTGIIGPGHEIAVDSKGNLYIAQTTAGLQKLTFKGMARSNS